MSRLFFRSLVSAILASALILPRTAPAETLRVRTVEGWKDVMNEKNDIWWHVESIPEAETLEGWTQMVTVQTFYRMGNVKPADFADQMRKKYLDACKAVDAVAIFSGKEDAFNVFVGILYCTENQATKKGEVTFLKIMQGNNGLYVVQWAKRMSSFAKEESAKAVPQDERATWIGFLRDARIQP